MKNVSTQFRNELNNGNRYYVKSAEITLKDGTTLEISNSNLWQNGMILESATSNSSSFDISSIIIGQLTLSLNNIDEEYSDYDFTDCTADNIRVGLELSDGTVESLSYGKFFLNDASYNGSIITLTFYDSLYKFDKSYTESTLEYPATLEDIVQDACEVCGVTLGTYGFDHDDYLINERPTSDGLTFRQVLLWVGQISCNYFTADPQGRLKISWYDTKSLEALITDVESSNLLDSAGDDILDSDDNPISTDKEVTTNEDNIVGGNYHIINHFSNLSVGLDDVVITGIKISYEEAGENGTEITTYQAGTDGYVLEISGNKLIQSGDAAQQIVQDLGAKIIGLRFRTFTASALSDPTYEAGDVALLIDRKGRRYKSLITNNTFQPGNFQSMSCGATAPARQSASRYSQITQVYVDYRKDLQKEKTEREQALEELQNRVDNASGLFTTIEQQPDGSNIYYLHNKPQLSDSDIVWTMTAEAWTVSTNGGETPNAGMTVDGDTIVRILTAVGVNADWIKTGAFVVEKDGQIMFRADTDTGQVDIVANSFSLQGQSISDIAEQQVNDFVDTVYTPAIDNLQAQIDGQIETWFYDYIPTTSNYPASNWTTDTERDKHLGDLFYVVDNAEYGGQAYRWAKINNAYTWDYVEDTAVTKALADAASAQDTADQKRRVFVSQPIPPYDVGDLWVGNSSSDLMRCQTSRQSGNYNAADWIKAVKYTDDSELQAFIQGDYADTIEEIKTQADQKAETWYQSTDPSINWSEDEKSEHKGDLWYNTSEEKTYIYNGTSWQETRSNPPDEVFDTINGKAQIFIAQPVTPYDVGDVWFTGTSIMVCNTARTSGNFNSADWQKKDNYTDDSALYEFIEGDYQSTIENLQEQADQKAETWYQATDPSASWSTADKAKHKGDLWYNTTEQKTYIYNGSAWEETKSNPPDEVFDTIDGKAQIYVNTPVPPYNVGDLWFNSSTSDIMTCINARSTGSYTASDWQKRNKYTDDSYAEQVAENLSIFSSAVTGDLENLQTEIDGKIETYYYDYQPTLTNVPASQWTTAQERAKHVGDLFYWRSKGFTYRFTPSGSSYVWQAIQDSDITEALQQAANAQDTADSKRRVFYTTPYPPYDVGDLWAQGSGGDIMRCKTARQSGAYASTDWELASKYTDDTAVDNLDESLDQEGVFNRLTNNGATQGIYLENGQLYINASYIQSGIVSADRIDVTGIFAQDITATGTITGANLVGATGTFSGTINASGGTFSGNIDCTGTITGANLVGATGTFTGTITGSTIVGGEIRSSNYVANSSGTIISLNDGIIRAANTHQEAGANYISRASFGGGSISAEYITPSTQTYFSFHEGSLLVSSYGEDGDYYTRINEIGIETNGITTSRQANVETFNCSASAWINDLSVSGQSDLDGGINTPYIVMKYSSPYIDFHYNYSTSSYTARLIADTSNRLSVYSTGGFYIRGGTITIGSQDSANEGGQINLVGAGSNKQICIDNLSGNLRIFTNGGHTITFDTSSGGLRMPFGGLTVGNVIESSVNTGSWLAGNNGTAIINSTSSGSNFNVLARMLAPTGRFIMGQYDGDFFLAYTRNSTIQAGTNYVDALAKLLNNNGNTTFPGTVTAVNFSNSSLEELKTNIVPFDSALEDILNTDVYSYSLKRDIDNGFYNTKYGFIIGTGYRLSEKILSEEKDGIELYSAIALLWKGVQELYELVSGMGIVDSRIDYLQSQLDQAFERIEQLKKASV